MRRRQKIGPRTARLHVRIPDGLARDLSTVADRSGRTKSQIVIDALCIAFRRATFRIHPTTPESVLFLDRWLGGEPDEL